MHDTASVPLQATRRPGRMYLALGIFAVLAGPVLYLLQLRLRILTVPWYTPVLATIGAALAITALLKARSISRWLAAGLFTAFAGAAWLAMLVLLHVPDYRGPVRVGHPFPEFTTARADGSTFTQDDLKGDKNSILVFFRGRW